MSNPDMLRGAVGPTLIRLAIPMMFGIVSIVLFQVVDTFYIGRLGIRELAAISFTFPLVFVVMSAAMGLSVGTTAVISKAIGEGDRHRVKRLTTDGLALSVVVVTALGFTGLATMRPIFRLMGAGPELMPLIEQYMTIWFVGVGLLVIPMVGNAAIRATGDTKTPSLIMAVSGGVNLIVDPLLIFGIGPFPRLEIQGAAIATLIAWVFTFGAALWVLGRRERMLALGRPRLREVIASWRQILHVGIPAAATSMLVPLSTAVITRLVSGYGPEAVAAFGVGGRIDSLAMIGTMAMASVLTPFIGQNWGAGQCDRVRASTRFAVRFSLVWGGVAWLLLVFLAGPVARIFNDDPRVTSATVFYLRIVPLSYGALGAAMLVGATYNALQRPLRSTLLVLIRLFIFAVPLALLGAQLRGVVGIFAGVAAANLAIGVIAYLWVREHVQGIDAEAPASERGLMDVGRLPEQVS